MTTTRDHDMPPPPPPPAPPHPGEGARPRRWSTGHTVAAAVVSLGVLAAGGVALAARDDATAATVPGAPGAGQQGQLPGGQPPGGQLGQAPDGRPPGGPSGDHDGDGSGPGAPGGQRPDGTGATGSVTT